MTTSHSDALVFFGATGDLAFKKIFPALQAMVKRGHLDVPVIGVGRSDWTADQLRARARESLEKQGDVDPAAFETLAGLLHYVSVDYSKPATFQALRKALGGAKRPGALPGHSSQDVRSGGGTPGEVRLRQGSARARRKTLRTRPGFCPGAQSNPAQNLRRVGDLPHRPLSRSFDRSMSVPPQRLTPVYRERRSSGG